MIRGLLTEAAGQVKRGAVLCPWQRGRRGLDAPFARPT